MSEKIVFKSTHLLPQLFKCFPTQSWRFCNSTVFLVMTSETCSKIQVRDNLCDTNCTHYVTEHPWWRSGLYLHQRGTRSKVTGYIAEYRSTDIPVSDSSRKGVYIASPWRQPFLCILSVSNAAHKPPSFGSSSCMLDHRILSNPRNTSQYVLVSEPPIGFVSYLGWLS